MSEKEYCKKYLPLLKKISEDKTLNKRCKDYNAYLLNDEDLVDELNFKTFLDEAYSSGIVISDYLSFTEKFDKNLIMNPTDEFISKLSEKEITACIAYHYRNDHWDNGALISTSFTNNSLLKYFEALINER